MSILTHGFDHRFEARRPARTSGARKGRHRRIVLQALTLLSMGSVLTALIALKTAIFVWRLHA